MLQFVSQLDQLNERDPDSDNLHSKYDSALVPPAVGNVRPELSKDLVAGATLTNDLETSAVQTKDHITGTRPTSPSYRA
jgi:hypothetical protein